MALPKNAWRTILFFALLVDACVVYGIMEALPSIDENATVVAATAGLIVLVVAIAATYLLTGTALAVARGVAVTVACGVFLLDNYAALGSPSPATYGLFAPLLIPVQLVAVFVTLRLRPLRVPAILVSTLGGAAAFVTLECAVLTATSAVIPVVRLAVDLPRFEADSMLTEAIVRVQSCAYQYRTSNPAQGYPSDLQKMGPGGTTCLDRRIANGRVSGVKLEYTTHRAVPGGPVEDYLVVGRAIVGPNGEAKMAAGDTSGMQRVGAPTARPSDLPVVDDQFAWLRIVQGCAAVYRSRHPAEGYPQELIEMEYMIELPGQPPGYTKTEGCPAVTFPRKGTGRTTSISYKTVKVGDVVTDYVVDVRPSLYGVHGIRSYRASSAKGVHVTKADRPATAEDPVIPEGS